MPGIEYVVRDESLKHASFSSFKSSLSDKYRKKKKEQATNRANGLGVNTKPIIGRSSSNALMYTKTPQYRNKDYASIYYDPEKRHQRYEEEKDHVTRPYGTGKSASKGSGKGSGKSSGNGSSKNVSDAIAKLREESSLDTEAHREEAKRRIEELRNQLKEHLERLKSSQDEESELNIASIRGKIQSIKEQIEATGQDLQLWIDNEREALQRRIAKLTGKNYDKEQVERQTALKNREKEISSRADALYKRRMKK